MDRKTLGFLKPSIQSTSPVGGWTQLGLQAHPDTRLISAPICPNFCLPQNTDGSDYLKTKPLCPKRNIINKAAWDPVCPAWLAPWCFSPRQPLCCPQAPTFKSMSSTTDAYTFLCSATGCRVIPIWKSKRRPLVSICTLKTSTFLIPKEMSGWKRHSTNVLDKTHREATQNVTTRRLLPYCALFLKDC